jgi:aryl-alcohol dehydrogenase-like predicted oxidoreductase
LLDTADSYESEPIIGNALAENEKRHQIILTTKVQLAVGPGPNDRDLSRLHIIKQCEESLRRLKTGYIDRSTHPAWTVMEALMVSELMFSQRRKCLRHTSLNFP